MDNMNVALKDAIMAYCAHPVVVLVDTFKGIEQRYPTQCWFVFSDFFLYQHCVQAVNNFFKKEKIIKNVCAQDFFLSFCCGIEKGILHCQRIDHPNM